MAKVTDGKDHQRSLLPLPTQEKVDPINEIYETVQSMKLNHRMEFEMIVYSNGEALMLHTSFDIPIKRAYALVCEMSKEVYEKGAHDFTNPIVIGGRR